MMSDRLNDAKALGDLADGLIEACRHSICGLPEALGTAFAGVLGEATPPEWPMDELDKLPPLDAPAPRYLTYPNI